MFGEFNPKLRGILNFSQSTWNGNIITGTYGGTGANNGNSKITIGGNVSFNGAFNFTGTLTNTTTVTFPTSGTLATTAQIPTGAALTGSNDTNVTITTGGSASTSLINAASLSMGWTGTLGLTRGGTAASLTASNGGIVYSNASTLAVLSGTSTATQMLQSAASTTPAWSTTTWPATSTVNQILYSSATNTVTGLTTANSSVLITSGGGVPSFSTTLPSSLAATSMTLTTPVLGTPSSGVLTSCTNLPITTGTTGTLTVARGGTGVTSIPKYRAYQGSAQTVTNSSATKVVFDTKSYDTATAYDNTTNYRYTATVAGYYEIAAQIVWDTVIAASPTYELMIYLNGAAVTRSTAGGSATIASGYLTHAVSDIIFLNGSTDYIEIFVLQITGGSTTYGTSFRGTVNAFVVASLLPG